MRSQKQKNNLTRLNEFLFPFHQFKDCNIGSRKDRYVAYVYNRSMKHLLLSSINNWAQGCCGLLILLQLAAIIHLSIFVEAFFGVCFSMAIVITVVQLVMWMHLTFVQEECL